MQKLKKLKKNSKSSPPTHIVSTLNTNHNDDGISYILYHQVLPFMVDPTFESIKRNKWIIIGFFTPFNNNHCNIELISDFFESSIKKFNKICFFQSTLKGQ